MKKEIRTILEATLEACFKKGLLKEAPIPPYVVETPNSPEHGHLATNLPMAFASAQRRAPAQIAAILLQNLQDTESTLESAQMAGPGFINFRIRPEKWCQVLLDAIEQKHRFGASTMGQGQRILVEYVSANPTGPLHLGHGRGAALGDTLCRILCFCGHEVVREFYINDAGQQIRNLGQSIYSRFKQRSDPAYPFPESGYHGTYVQDLAEQMAAGGNLDGLSLEEAVSCCVNKGKAILLEEIQSDLNRFRVNFDVWTSESVLTRGGVLEETLKKIQASGHLYEKDGAQWIRTTTFGDDKDRVIRKSDGEWTYFSSDIAYHLQKHERGFTRAINIWGADHHGYVPRIKAALAAEGIPDDWLTAVLIQLVKLWEGGQEIKMSKRAGSFVTLQELMDEVGVDAIRFVFLTKSHDSPLDFNVDLVKKQDSDNPVYYVQYAHARLCSIFRKAEAEGVAEAPASMKDLARYLVLEEEMALIRTMADFPPLLEEICRTLEPHRLTYFLTDLAAQFHRYFNLGNQKPDLRVISPHREQSQARLILARGVKTVLANGLNLLGISAPERM